jgi:hypothetical protein
MPDPTTDVDRRSRRALLTAATGAAAAVAATMVAPVAVLGADPDDVQKNVDNGTTGVTSILQQTADTDAFVGRGQGSGVGLVGRTTATTNAGVVGYAGDKAGSVYDTHPFDVDAGVYGYTGQTDVSSGVFGEGPTGVYGLGDIGVFADGATIGLFASGYPSGTGVHAHAGAGAPPASVTNVALMGSVTSTNQAGIYATGRVMFPHRSGRAAFSANARTKTVSVSGMTSSNYALAVLNTYRSGVYVTAVVPAAGKITIYLNKAVTSTTYVAWFVLG